MNNVNLIGNVANVAELRETNSGQPVLNLLLAVDNPGYPDRTDWIPVVIWGKGAEHCSRHITRGSKIAIEGKLQTRDVNKANGSTERAFEVVAKNIDFLYLKPQE